MKFENKISEKALLVTLEGFASDENAGAFVNLLKQEVAKVAVKDYSLIIDSTNLLTFKPAILPVLEQSYKLYMSFGFKNIYMISPKNAAAKMQLQRVARGINFTGSFVDSIQEAYSK